VAIEPNTRLGHYRVQSLLGAGAIGEVYLALDEERGDPAAVKVLKPEHTNSREHLRRFEREARIISSLNHPNILTIREIGREGATHFIATEFIHGWTLRQVIRHTPPGVAQSLDIAAQTLSALAVAHEAGVVHRDVKPENVMVRRDGQVKVLDFGLAKLADDLPRQPHLSGDSTVSNVVTNSGAVIGTVAYMSPEQLRGLSVDARTDVWSVGVVLYEMITGRKPFADQSPADIIVSILEREPPPLTVYAPDCPGELQRIITRALAKDRERRYQTAGELLEDLSILAAQLPADDEGARGEPAASGVRAHASGTASGGGVASPGRPGVEVTPARKSLRTPRLATARRAAVAGAGVLAVIASAPLLGPNAALVLAVVLLLAGSAYMLSRGPDAGAQARPTEGVPFRNINLSRLTNTGRAIDAAVSPDGRYVVYVREEAGRQSLWVRELATTGNFQILPPADVSYQGMTFSADCGHVYYVCFNNSNRRLYFLYRIPVLGGACEMLLEDVDTPITFSPDGDSFAFVRGYPSQKEVVLMVAKTDLTEERRLATRRSPAIFGWRGGPAWSPDGKVIACSVGIYDADMRLVAISTDDGSERPLSPRVWPWVGRLAWLHDGSGLLVNAREEASGFSQLWFVSYPGGEARRITNDLSDYGTRSLSLTSDSRALVSVQNDYLSGIWVVARGEPSNFRQLTAGRSDGYYGLCWTPDGRIVYASKASGNQDIWIMDADGGGQTQLTFDAGSNYHPSVTPDGRHLIFISTRSGAPNIWRMRVDGGDPRQLTNGSIPGWPQSTPDGRWVIYKAMGYSKKSLCKVPIGGGVPVQVSDKYTGCIAVSPDGESIACEYWDERLTSQSCLAVLPFDGGGEVTAFEGQSTAAASNYLLSVIRWSPDGELITYIDNRDGLSNIWGQPVAGGPPRRLTEFRSDRIFWFDWSRDGQWLACARGVISNDVVLIRSE
jgi:Tol biopolymer transport system component